MKKAQAIFDLGFQMSISNKGDLQPFCGLQQSDQLLGLVQAADALHEYDRILDVSVGTA